MTSISRNEIQSRLRSAHAALVNAGFAPQPYVVGPQGRGVFCKPVNAEIESFVSLAYFEAYRSVGVYLGFCTPSLARWTARSLEYLGRVLLGMSPRYAIANPCPAILFHLESYSAAGGGPFPVTESAIGEKLSTSVMKTVESCAAELSSPLNLGIFLGRDRPGFLWAAGEVPRRLIQVSYLLARSGVQRTEIESVVAPAAKAIKGDADFGLCDGGQLISEALDFTFRMCGEE